MGLKTHQLEPPPLGGNWGCLLLPPFTARGVQVEDALRAAALRFTLCKLAGSLIM